MKNYGQLPTKIGEFIVPGKELFFYQYLPIKLVGQVELTVEPRLHIPLQQLLGTIACDFVGVYGLDRYVASNIYLTAKRKLHTPEKTITRPGWHTDGFMTDDINYIWSDVLPTVFNNSNFNLTQDDQLSIEEMGLQAKPENNVTYPDNSLLRLDQYVVHRASNRPLTCVRTFIKVSFSYDKYDLEGNSINYLLNYNWKMRPRSDFRNIPQHL